MRGRRRARVFTALLRRVDRGRLVAHHLHAVAAQAVVACRDFLHRRVAGEHEVGDRARDEARPRARPAPPRLPDPTCECTSRPSRRRIRRRSTTTRRLQAPSSRSRQPTARRRPPASFRKSRRLNSVIAASSSASAPRTSSPAASICSSRVALGDLVHHRRRALAVAESPHLRGDVILRQARERNRRPWLRRVRRCRDRSSTAAARFLAPAVLGGCSDGRNGECRREDAERCASDASSLLLPGPGGPGDSGDRRGRPRAQPAASLRYRRRARPSPHRRRRWSPCRRAAACRTGAHRRAPAGSCPGSGAPSGAHPSADRTLSSPGAPSASWVNAASTFFSASCSSSCIRNLSTTRRMTSGSSARERDHRVQPVAEFRREHAS